MELWLNTAFGLRLLGFPEHLFASFGRPGEGSMPARTCVKQPGKTCIQPQSNSQARTVPILDVFNLVNCVQLICSQQPSVRIKAACKFVLLNATTVQEIRTAIQVNRRGICLEVSGMPPKVISPSKLMAAPVVRWRPLRMFSSVLLPQPDGPMTPVRHSGFRMPVTCVKRTQLMKDELQHKHVS